MNLNSWRWGLRIAFVALQGLLVLTALAGFRTIALAIALADALICSGVAIYLSHPERRTKSRRKRPSRREG